MAAAGVGITAQILSGLIAEALSKGDRDLAEHYLQQAANDGNIPLPDLQKIAAETLGPSAMESVSTDPRLESAQYAALDKLQGISDAGGYTLTDEANLNRILGKTNRAANAQNAAVREDMAARGVGGSGAEVAMQLANNQAQAQRGADEASTWRRRPSSGRWTRSWPVVRWAGRCADSPSTSRRRRPRRRT
jgi:hypothetical protein